MVLDKLHSNGSTLTTCSDGAMHEAVAAIAGCGVSPLVRIAANEGWMVKSTLLQVGSGPR